MYNCDETGISKVQRYREVVAEGRRKEVGRVT
jgi:hypothetical protein